MNYTSQLQLEVSDLQTEISVERSVTSRADVIAAIGVNHDGKVGQAIDLIDAARDAGADVVKFQTFRAESVVSVTTPEQVTRGRGTRTRVRWICCGLLSFVARIFVD